MGLLTPLISMEALTKIFYTEEIETHALSDITLQIAQGEFVAIAGPSGCGKTTLLSIIGLLAVPTSGTYLLHGRRVDGLSASHRARIRGSAIGFVFQSFHLLGSLTALENVALPLAYRDLPHAECQRRVREALARVGMTHRVDHYPSQLSGGQQQRVAVAQAIVGNPDIILADEPTGNLDSKNSASVMELLRELHRDGATICMVTHDPRYAHVAEREIRLFDGRIVEGRG